MDSNARFLDQGFPRDQLHLKHKKSNFEKYKNFEAIKGTVA